MTFDENVIDTAHIDEDSVSDEEVQTEPGVQVKSVPMLAQPSDNSGAAADTASQEGNNSPAVTSEPNGPQQEPVLRRSSRRSQSPLPSTRQR